MMSDPHADFDPGQSPVDLLSPPQPAAPAPAVAVEPATDAWTVRAVVIVLGLVALVGEVGLISLVARGAGSTDPAAWGAQVALVAQLPTAAAAAIATLLASTRSRVK